MKKARRKRHIACDGLQGAVKTDIFTMSKTAAHRAAANCESSEAGHSWNGGTRERAEFSPQAETERTGAARF